MAFGIFGGVLNFVTLFNSFFHWAFMNLYFHAPMHLNNLGTNIRTLEIVGLKSFYIYDEFDLVKSRANWKPNKERKFQGFSTGAIQYVHWEYVQDPKAFLKNWPGRRIATIAAMPEAHTLWDFEFKESDLLVMGNESHGLFPEIIACCDTFLTIPQFGQTHSFNLSVATGMILYEYLRQRENK